jgi:prevent-host-death family protein
MATWSIAKAKAQLSEVVHLAEKTGPQKISRSGREIAVIVSVEEWKGLKQSAARPPEKEESVYDFLMNSPLVGSGLKMPRRSTKLRPLDL